MFPFVGRVWEFVKDVWHVLWPMRFSVIVLIVVWLLLGLDQSQDALLALITDEGRGRAQPLFIAFIFIWAFQTYYWARFMSRLPAKPRPPRLHPPLVGKRCLDGLNRELPRLLGLLAIAVVATRYPQSATAGGVVVGTAAILAMLLYAVAGTRRYAIQRLSGVPRVSFQTALFGTTPRDLLAPVRPTWVSEALIGLLAVVTLGVCFFGGPQWIIITLAIFWLLAGGVLFYQGRAWLPTSTWWTLIINSAVVVLLFILSLSAERWVASGITAPVIVLSAASAWVFVGTFFISFPSERYGVPVATLIVAVAVANTWITPHDNHDVRKLVDISARGQKIEEAFSIWYKQAHAAWSARGESDPVPLVIVATAGGASRAGYWTARVLGSIEDSHPDFHRYVFAVSSVSGGSLGAAVWRELIEAANADPKARPISYAQKAGEYFSRDFLSPVFFSGLYADLVQRFLPGRLLPDRATALERSWEEAWAAIMPDAGADRRFRAPFHSTVARPGQNWAPLLLMNGTSEATGRRIITAPIRITPEDFPDAIDFFHHFPNEIPLSVAIHNSARFPYIDAAGNIRLKLHGEQDDSLVDRIVDGGYFENFGAGTAYDLLETLYRIRGNNVFRPIIIQISSDPALNLPEARNSAVWNKPLSGWLKIASDALTPPIAFWNTRDGVGYRTTLELKELVEGNVPIGVSPANALAKHEGNGANGLYIPFRLLGGCPGPEPMSWALSSEARRTFTCEWERSENVVQLGDLAKALWPGKEGAGRP